MKYACLKGEGGEFVQIGILADKIRNLAEQSNQFTGEISKIIKDLTDKTSSGVKTMEELEQIVSSQSESVEMTNKWTIKKKILSAL